MFIQRQNIVKMGNTISSDDAWAQDVISQLTPNISTFAKAAIRGRVEPAVQGTLKKHSDTKDGGKLSSTAFKIEELDFGTQKPKITNVSTLRSHHDDPGDGSSPSSIIVDFDLEYQGDSNIQVKIMGIPSGVRDLHVSGRARVVLKPTTKSPPFFGGFQFCFLDDMAIDFDLDGIADICDWPFMRRKIRKAIIKDASEQLVFPNKIFVPMSGAADPMIVKCFDPRGVLAVKVCSATGLPEKSGLRSLLGQGKPDTYIVTKLGAHKHETPVIKNDAEPVWEDPTWYYFLLERAEGHRVNFLAYDEDSFSKDDFLGKAVASLEGITEIEGEQEMALPLIDDALDNSDSEPNEIAGELNVMIKWMPLGLPRPENPQAAVLTVFIYSCNNVVPPDNGRGIPEQIAVKVTPPNPDRLPIETTQTKKNTQHPIFEEGFVFTLREASEWDEGSVSFEVLDEASGIVYGNACISTADLENAPMNRQICCINPDEPMITITFSAKIAFA